ncbi:hypothetical protein BOTBODRAFT_26159 [Botryobasidium botryosum FD-172 SS1]|uniref:Haloacid dehalogenase-like hydrolase domain-containing protein 3 n=1 Tax=Botryobasidium botryosum (strain FD-172 SS1) TaxID=930990 RepID=A0A067NC83_BOTB1|nr:hypothetical protein BOTBODRAFT_26159 [Botryobasidium botryosum FD-172 SS1]
MPRPALVLFDALHTLVTPRAPIAVQYAQTFSPYFCVAPEAIRASFQSALKEVQTSSPVYGHTKGVDGWWTEVIRKTAVGAGANPLVVEEALPEVVPRLMKRFSSKEGYKLFDDVIPSLHALREIGLRTGLVSNADIRMRNVLADLGALDFMDPCVLSELEGIEKPDTRIWDKALERSAVWKSRSEVVHVGDELEADYRGAERAGLVAVLLRREGVAGDREVKEAAEDLTGVRVVKDLHEVVCWIKASSQD